MVQTIGDGGGSSPQKRAKRNKSMITSSMPTPAQLKRIRAYNKKHPNNKKYWR